MDAKQVYEVVMKLIGPTDPVGDSLQDIIALVNTKELIKLTDRLIGNISSLRSYTSFPEVSVQKVGEEARNYLIELENQLPY